jgi:hypothetical protein
MRTFRKLKRGTTTALLATLVGVSAVALPIAASANLTNVSALLATNVPIIVLPPVTTPIEGTGGTTTSPEPVNPDPAPLDPPAPAPGSPVAPEEPSIARKGGDDLYVYIVLQKDYKEGAPIAKSTPGVLGKPWRAVRSMEKKPFHFPLLSVAAGNEYYVVGIRRVGKKLEYTSKHPVRVERD